MKAGTLRHRVTIQDPIYTSDEYGQTTLTWVDVINRYASIEPLQGRELANGKQIAAEATHKITVRFYPVQHKQRLLFGERVFNVLAVQNTQERSLESVILAVEQCP